MTLILARHLIAPLGDIQIQSAQKHADDITGSSRHSNPFKINAL